MAAEAATGRAPRCLLVGLACIDIVAKVDRYPEEDTDVRCLGVVKTRGGNATNSAVVAQQLGLQCDWIGTTTDLATDDDARFMSDDLHGYGVSDELCVQCREGAIPTSYIFLSKETGSRTIVHNRDLPELSLAQFFGSILGDASDAGRALAADGDALAGSEALWKALQRWSWIHFEGRNVPVTAEIMSIIRRNRVAFGGGARGAGSSWSDVRAAGGPVVSIELEKPVAEAPVLTPHADVVFASKEYAANLECDSAEAVLARLRELTETALLVCAWGADGAWAKDVDGDAVHSDAFPPAELVDTLAAGDTFNASVIWSLCRGDSPERAITIGCSVAGAKCGRFGLMGITDGVAELRP